MIRSNALRASREKACKQNFRNFRFLASRVSVRMKVIPSESYELAVFYEIIATMFGVLLIIYVWPPQYYFQVLHNGIKAIFEMIMRMHSGPGTGLHRQIMWWIIIPPTPSHVTSDLGSEFVLHFFHSLGKLLQMRLHFTSGYHPEGDRQMEHANQVLEQYLQVYTNYQQDDWVMLLPMAKFTYNNAINAMTGVSPFFANKGYHPEFTADLQVKTSSAKAQVSMVDLECIQAELKENIAQAQERYQKNADKHRAEAPELNISDQAYVKVKFFRTRHPSKNSQKEPGPI